MSKIFADRYRIDRELGRGSFGVVYLAKEVRLDDREVALKVLDSGLEQNPGFLGAFEKEVGLLARLRHDNIVTIYDANVWHNKRYLAMEYINGPSLAQVVKEEGAQPPERVVNWLRDAAQALAYAHGEGFIHRDIKSANLLWDKHQGRLYVADFGLARAVELSGGSSSGRSLEVLTGTAAYRAPEVRKTGHTVASDLYSLGVVGYELLAGELPFKGADPFDIGMAHLTDPAPPLPKEIPNWLQKVILRLLEKEPANRYPSAAALLADLGKTSTLAIQPISERDRQKPWFSRFGLSLLLLGLLIAIVLPRILGSMPVSHGPQSSDRPPLTVLTPGAMEPAPVTDSTEEHSGNVAAAPTSTPTPLDMARPFKPVGGKKSPANIEVRGASLDKNGTESGDEENTSNPATVGNILVCVPRDVLGHATIHLWRLAVDRTSWEEIPKFSVGPASLDASIDLVKIPGIPIDATSWGKAGQPYRLELWVNSQPVASIGDTDHGQPVFRVYPGRDNIAPDSFCQ